MSQYSQYMSLGRHHWFDKARALICRVKRLASSYRRTQTCLKLLVCSLISWWEVDCKCSNFPHYTWDLLLFWYWNIKYWDSRLYRHIDPVIYLSDFEGFSFSNIAVNSLYEKKNSNITHLHNTKSNSRNERSTCELKPQMTQCNFPWKEFSCIVQRQMSIVFYMFYDCFFIIS